MSIDSAIHVGRALTMDGGLWGRQLTEDGSTPAASGSMELPFLEVNFWMGYVTGSVEIVIGCLVALLIFLIFYTVFGCIVRVVNKIMTNPKKPVDPVVRPFVTTGLKIVMWIQVIPIILGRISAPIETSVTNIIGNVTLSVGLAMKPMVENFISGLVIAVTKPFSPGHIVTIGGVTGKVREVRALFTIVDEPDGDVIYVPNAKCLGGAMNNYSLAGNSRIDVGSFGLEHSADLDMARAQMLEALKGVDKVLQDPKPDMIVTATTPTSVVVAARVWVKPTDRPPAPFLVREAVLKRFKSHGVPVSCWHSGHVVASAVASLHEAGFPKSGAGSAGAGGGAGDNDDDMAAVAAMSA